MLAVQASLRTAELGSMASRCALFAWIEGEATCIWQAVEGRKHPPSQAASLYIGAPPATAPSMKKSGWAGQARLHLIGKRAYVGVLGARRGAAPLGVAWPGQPSLTAALPSRVAAASALPRQKSQRDDTAPGKLRCQASTYSERAEGANRAITQQRATTTTTAGDDHQRRQRPGWAGQGGPGLEIWPLLTRNLTPHVADRAVGRKICSSGAVEPLSGHPSCKQAWAKGPACPRASGAKPPSVQAKREAGRQAGRQAKQQQAGD
ncbi:uncharacterized protein PSFLO_02495 [Pseudozyma flocculosa]|uniref:Uncharacterized protein n=1 Tax=Pseudozyma flocculosa TaxID=84751 RepID=A0A5C3EXN1_9BASI|nr:uncharacterized protein PSFLO_02495 [Pseudozyma flocculosa]